MSALNTAESPAPVAIVGAGPTGLSLALGLARHGVRSILLERKPRTSAFSKAPGIHVRTREIFRQWGIEERFIAAGILQQTVVQHNAVPGRRPLMTLDFTELETEADRPGILILEQAETERFLLEALRETGMCDVRFEAEAFELHPGASDVHLLFRQAGVQRSLQAEFVVGCDGASSFVRDALGLPFEGITYSVRPMLADVRVGDERDRLPWPRYRNAPGGLAFTVRLRPGLWRIIRLEHREPAKGDEVPEAEVNQWAGELLGHGPVEVVWASRFRIHLRSSPRFRVGRVLLAGDAAHVHSPVGGMGMNAGIQDAHNLAWKLAYALRGGEVDRLLDSYEIERRAVVVESVSTFTDLLTRAFIQAPAMVREAAFFLSRLLLAIPPVRRKILRRLTMLELTYRASPLLYRRERFAGIRLPNLKLRSPDGAGVRLYDLLPNGPAILDVADDRDLRAQQPVAEVIRIGPGGHHDPTGSLRALLGQKDGWILVRPDAHIAWARTRDRLDGIAGAVQHALGGKVWSGRLSKTRESRRDPEVNIVRHKD